MFALLKDSWGNGFEMPEIYWWDSYEHCRSFWPDNDHSIIRCQDADLDPSQAARWRWTTTGKNLGGMADLYAPPFIVGDSEIIVPWV